MKLPLLERVRATGRDISLVFNLAALGGWLLGKFEHEEDDLNLGGGGKFI